ncbi:MAG TPA: ester cyclase [Vicinamibacterales bacterium]|nr:ester cyclase [Vicinamibacterales bacterium]
MGLEENKAIMRQWLGEGWSKGNVDVADAIVSPDFTVHGAGGQEVKSGPNGVKELVRTWRKAFPDGVMQVLDDIAEGPYVGVRLLWTGTHLGDFYGAPPTGNKVTCSSIGIDEVRDGKICGGWGELDMLGLMQQVHMLAKMGPDAPADPVADAPTVPRPTTSSIAENKQVVLKFVEAINKWDLDGARALCADSYVEHNPAWGAISLKGTFDTYAMVRAALPDLNFASDTGLMVGEGDRVVLRGTVTGTHTGADLFGVKASGKKLEWTGIDISRVTDGKITERWLSADILRLMQELGLVPTPG